VPLLSFSALMFWRDVQLRRDAVERGMRNTARALSLAVDREIGNILAVAQTLAASPHISAQDFKAFYELSAGAAKNSKIAAIALFGRNGQMIINTTEQYGTSLPNPLRGSKKVWRADGIGCRRATRQLRQFWKRVSRFFPICSWASSPG